MANQQIHQIAVHWRRMLEVADQGWVLVRTRREQDRLDPEDKDRLLSRLNLIEHDIAELRAELEKP